jgi:gluconolactonase
MSQYRFTPSADHAKTVFDLHIRRSKFAIGTHLAGCLTLIWVCIFNVPAIAATPSLAATKPVQHRTKQSTVDARALARRFYAVVVNQRGFDQLNDFISADYMQHAPGLTPGRAGVAQFLTFITTAVPDIQTEVQHLVLDGDTLVAVVKWNGTQTGRFGDLPPTGNPVSFTVAEIFRVKGGKFSEHWSVVDQTDMLVTMGALQPAAASKQATPEGIDGVVAKDARVVLVADGYKHAEGPVWTPNGALLFSDVKGDRMLSVTDQRLQVYRVPSGYANGNAFDLQGNLYTAQHDRRITRTDKAGIVTTLVDRFNGKRLNSPNDLVVRSDGSIYFTDPSFGLMGYGPAKGVSELGFAGVYRLDAQGTLALLTRDLQFPNGIAFTPDEKTLYVNDGANSRIHAFPVNSDGSLGESRVFADLSIVGKEPYAEGMRVDATGRLYAGNLDGVWVFSPQGILLGKIKVPQPVSNLAFGGLNDDTLYITAGTALYKVNLIAKSIPTPVPRPAN